MAEPSQGRSFDHRRRVPARLVETQPGAIALGHWMLASPLLIFLLWVWTDLFAHFSPVASYWADALIGLIVFSLLIVLPLGYGAHRLVTGFPGLFQHAGWDVQPLQSVATEEQYSVRYVYHDRRRAPTTPRQIVTRAGQGWVYLEIATVFVGAIAMVPLFFSALDYGFGQ